MKAEIGDYIRFDDELSKVTGIYDGEGYLLENGCSVSDDEISIDDVLLESEAWEVINRG